MDFSFLQFLFFLMLLRTHSVESRAAPDTGQTVLDSREPETDEFIFDEGSVLLQDADTDGEDAVGSGEAFAQDQQNNDNNETIQENEGQSVDVVDSTTNSADEEFQKINEQSNVPNTTNSRKEEFEVTNEQSIVPNQDDAATDQGGTSQGGEFSFEQDPHSEHFLVGDPDETYSAFFYVTGDNVLSDDVMVSDDVAAEDLIATCPPCKCGDEKPDTTDLGSLYGYLEEQSLIIEKMKGEIARLIHDAHGADSSQIDVECPEDFTFVETETETFCIHRVDGYIQQATWRIANVFCQSLGSGVRLFQPTSSEKMEATINTVLRRKGKDTTYWIGPKTEITPIGFWELLGEYPSENITSLEQKYTSPRDAMTSPHDAMTSAQDAMASAQNTITSSKDVVASEQKDNMLAQGTTTIDGTKTSEEKDLCMMLYVEASPSQFYKYYGRNCEDSLTFVCEKRL